MAKLCAVFPIVRTMCNMTFYMDRGENIVRQKSSLTGKRVKKSPEFARTRAYAEMLAQASKIASVIYQALPEGWRQYWMFRAFTGEALGLIKQGKTREEAIAELMKVYVAEIRYKEQESRYKIQEARYKVQNIRTRRKYTKKDMEYWKNKTEKAIIKAQKRKAQQEKLQYYAGLMAKASKIGSVVYQSLPKEKRQYWQYKSLTGMAMRLLKEELEVEMVTEFLGSEVGDRKSEVRSQMSDLPAEAIAEVGVESKKSEVRRRKPAVNNNDLRRMNTLFYIPRNKFGLKKKSRVKRKKREKTYNNLPP